MKKLFFFSSKEENGILLGAGFWSYGYHIMRALENKLTQVSPTRIFSMELRAAIAVLLASRLEHPMSTPQCLTGATIGVAFMNLMLRPSTGNMWLLFF
jgi:phosphate/sulfate permease